MNVRTATAPTAAVLLYLLLCLGIQNAEAQADIQHQSPVGIPSGDSHELEFRLSGLTSGEIQEAVLHYRPEGARGYETVQAEVRDGRIVADMPIEGRFTESIEYFLEVAKFNGEQDYYPAEEPERNPFTVNIIESDEPEIELLQQIDYNILNPQPGEELARDDVLLNMALFYEGEAASPESFRVYFMGREVTDEASITPFLISYVPASVPPGEHRARITYQDEGEEHDVAEWTFYVLEETIAELQEERTYIPQGNLHLNARNQTVSGIQRDVYQARLQMSGNLAQNVHYSLHGRLTSQESSRLQPQNRYGGELHAGDWLSLRLGHVNPRLTPLMISGRRVHGLNAELRMLDERINLDLIYGNLARDISNQFTSLQMRVDTLGTLSGDEVVTDTTFALGFDQGGRGTYQRRIMGGSLAFGSEENFQLGLNALKVEDDAHSLELIEQVDDIPVSMLEELTPTERNMLEENPEMFNFQGNPPNPRGNFLFGSDFSLRADNHRITVDGEAGLSLLNEDISGGYLDRERAEDLGFPMDTQTENLLGRLSSLIIINENMSLMPLRFSNGEPEPFVPMGIFGFQSSMNLNYFDHSLQLQYQWIGPSYVSLANNALRRDRAGFRVSDRFRVIDNQVRIRLDYENFDNNVIDHLDATTSTNRYGATVGWLPRTPDMPRISLNTRYQTRNNQIGRAENPYLEDAGISSDRAVRNTDFSNLVLESLPTPRDRSTWRYGLSIRQQFHFLDLQHHASMNLNRSRTRDRVFAYGDINSNHFNLELESIFPDRPLELTLSTSYTGTESSGGLNKLTITGFGIGGRYRFLDDRISVRSELGITQNVTETTGLTVHTLDPEDADPDPIFLQYYAPQEDEAIEDLTYSYVFSGNARYRINSNHSIVLDARFNNLVAREVERMMPNERYARLQYEFSF